MPKVYKGFDFYTHEHSAKEEKAVEYLNENGFEWKAYGEPARTVFVATKDGITDELSVMRDSSSLTDEIRLFEVYRKFHVEYEAVKRAYNKGSN